MRKACLVAILLLLSISIGLDVSLLSQVLFLEKRYNETATSLVEHVKNLELTISELQNGVKTLVDGTQTKQGSFVVVRIDDIQDYAFRTAQLRLLEYNIALGLPMSLAIIPDAFGLDREIVDLVSYATTKGSEVTVHGWKNLTQCDMQEQIGILKISSERLEATIGVKPTVLVPPGYDFNNNTLQAMSELGYSVISSDLKRIEPGVLDLGIISIPATVDFSNFVNGTWQMRNYVDLVIEISRSVRLYGYAVIVVHPQEFLTEGKFDYGRFEDYQELAQYILEKYKPTTIDHINSYFYAADK